MFKKLTYAWALYKTLQAQGKVPMATKTLVVIAVIYVLVPLDFLPDFMPLLGYIDDGILFASAVYYAWQKLNKQATPADRARASAIDVEPK